jgi:ATP-binding cassette subfamily G (WHITE) protein 2 (PDR)
MASSDHASASSTTPTVRREDSLVNDKATESEKMPTYEPIRTSAPLEKDQADYAFPMEDRPGLARLASKLSRNDTQISAPTDELRRWGTVAGMDQTDPRLDPDKQEFNFFLWARKFVMLLEQQGIRRRRAGFTFRDLSVSGTGAAVQLQKNVGSAFMVPLRLREEFGHAPEKQILRNFNGSVRQGEMLIVLGRPGSGCSTFLKSICGEHNGLNVSEKSTIHYNGIPQKDFIKSFRGDVVYNQENEKHFPHLLVGQTLEFAAACRTP